MARVGVFESYGYGKHRGNDSCWDSVDDRNGKIGIVKLPPHNTVRRKHNCTPSRLIASSDRKSRKPEHYGLPMVSKYHL